MLVLNMIRVAGNMCLERLFQLRSLRRDAAVDRIAVGDEPDLLRARADAAQAPDDAESRRVPAPAAPSPVLTISTRAPSARKTRTISRPMP